MNFIKKNGAGLSLCLIIAVPGVVSRTGSARDRRSGILDPDRHGHHAFFSQKKTPLLQGSITHQKKYSRLLSYSSDSA